MSKNHLYKGGLSTILLKILSDEGRMYGYQLSKRAKELTNGDLDITEGALYPTLHKLEAEGILETEIEKVGNRKRKYYKLTEEGQYKASERIDELKEYVMNLQGMLNGGMSHG